jgi:O-antigen ligase
MFFIQVFSFKLAALLTSAIAGAFGLFLLFSSHADYVIQGFTETLAFFQQNQPANTTSSMGLRLHFWQSAWMMVAQAPWFGHGIGSFPYEYQKLFPTMQPVFNPHNEYLLLATQLGLTGLLVFLGFIGMLIRQTLQVQGRDEQLLQGVLVIFIVSCLFNSSLFDHSEGYWLIFLVALFSSHLQKCEQG